MKKGASRGAFFVASTFVFSTLYLPHLLGARGAIAERRCLALGTFSLLQQRVDVAGQFVVLARHHAASIMGVQFDAHVAERVHHGGMMGVRLR